MIPVIPNIRATGTQKKMDNLPKIAIGLLHPGAKNAGIEKHATASIIADICPKRIFTYPYFIQYATIISVQSLSRWSSQISCIAGPPG